MQSKEQKRILVNYMLYGLIIIDDLDKMAESLGLYSKI